MIYSIFKDNIDAVKNHQQNIEMLVTTNNQLIPTISYWAIQKSISNLHAITQFYFPLQDIPEADFLRFMPLLVFVEATIYQIDEEYENNINNPNFISKHISVLKNVLTELNLFDNKLENELQEGLSYYHLEQQFCSGATITHKNIDNASLFKCFDIGILHRLLFKLTNQTYNEELLEISRMSDQICKIHTDLEDYKKDVERNVINTYRMFVRLYGSDAAQQLRHYLETLNYNLEHRLQLLKKTKPDMAKKFIKLYNAELENFPAPEIPEPILEEWKEVVGCSTRINA